MNLPKIVAKMRLRYHANMIDVVNVGNQLGIISDEKAEEMNKNHAMTIFTDILPRLGIDVFKKQVERPLAEMLGVLSFAKERRITMAEVTTFKKSIWRKIDEKQEELKQKYGKKADEIKKSLQDPATVEKIKKTATWAAGATLFVLQIRKELKPTLADIERHQKAYSFYDPHTHIRFATRRRVSPAVANEILERTSRGERAYDILREKHLIK